MRGIVLLFVVVMAACEAAEESKSVNNCFIKPEEDESFKVVDAGFKSMTEKCAVEMRAQVDKELNAALTYMAMGAHFSLDSVNRPGFAKMFFESASEEREHAFKIIEYLLMRGLLEDIDVKTVISNSLSPVAVKWESPLAAMKSALELEISVTKSITNIVKVCENASDSDKKHTDKETREKESKALFNNDFHLVDYLTGDFLEEQLHGQRELAGKIATLGKMMHTQGELAEFLFDKKLLSGEPL